MLEHWPQYIMASLLIFGFFQGLRRSTMSPKFEDARFMYAVIDILVFLGVSYTLYAGGFWKVWL